MATRRIMRDALRTIARLNASPDELKMFAQTRPDAWWTLIIKVAVDSLSVWAHYASPGIIYSFSQG